MNTNTNMDVKSILDEVSNNRIYINLLNNIYELKKENELLKINFEENKNLQKKYEKLKEKDEKLKEKDEKLKEKDEKLKEKEEELKAKEKELEKEELRKEKQLKMIIERMGWVSDRNVVLRKINENLQKKCNMLEEKKEKEKEKEKIYEDYFEERIIKTDVHKDNIKKNSVRDDFTNWMDNLELLKVERERRRTIVGLNNKKPYPIGLWSFIQEKTMTSENPLRGYKFIDDKESQY
jgi:chromosome segregation ATPase